MNKPFNVYKIMQKDFNLVDSYQKFQLNYLA